MKHANQKPESPRDEERMQLGYCQRCGALHVAPAASTASICPGCARVFRWLGGKVSDATRNL